jgi:hypothetical protein
MTTMKKLKKNKKMDLDFIEDDVEFLDSEKDGERNLYI